MAFVDKEQEKNGQMNYITPNFFGILKIIFLSCGGKR